MKTIVLSMILCCSYVFAVHAQQEEQTEKPNVRQSKASLKEKSQQSLSSPQKSQEGGKETSSSNGDARRAKAVVKTPSEELNIEGAPDGVSSSSKEEYAKSKAKWISNYPYEYEKIIKSRKTIIKQTDFDQLSPERKKIILNHPELYEITE